MCSGSDLVLHGFNRAAKQLGEFDIVPLFGCDQKAAKAYVIQRMSHQYLGYPDTCVFKDVLDMHGGINGDAPMPYPSAESPLPDSDGLRRICDRLGGVVMQYPKQQVEPDSRSYEAEE